MPPEVGGGGGGVPQALNWCPNQAIGGLMWQFPFGVGGSGTVGQRGGGGIRCLETMGPGDAWCITDPV